MHSTLESLRSNSTNSVLIARIHVYAPRPRANFVPIKFCGQPFRFGQHVVIVFNALHCTATDACARAAPATCCPCFPLAWLIAVATYTAVSAVFNHIMAGSLAVASLVQSKCCHAPRRALIQAKASCICPYSIQVDRPSGWSVIPPGPSPHVQHSTPLAFQGGSKLAHPRWQSTINDISVACRTSKRPM